MLLKVIRENETTYYITEHIRKIMISPVYGSDELYDVAFYIENQSEIVKVFDNFAKAEDFVRRINQVISGKAGEDIIDLSTF